MDYYRLYYDSQSGMGGGLVGNGSIDHAGLGRIFVGSPYQRGHGIGSFLGGLFRRVLPLLTRGAKAVGKEAWHAGLNVLTDVAQNVPVKQSLTKRARESGANLKRKAEAKLDKLMEGSGYKPKRRAISAQSTGTARTVKNTRKKSKKKKKKKIRCKKNRKIVGKKKKKNKKKKKETKFDKQDIFH